MCTIQTVCVDDITMDVATIGKGQKPFVMLPGISITPVTPLAEAVGKAYAPLLKDHTIFLFDRRRPAPDEYTVFQMAEDTFRVMQALGIRQSAVYGVSQGGMMALALALAHPSCVSHLLLSSTAATVSPHFRETFCHWIALAEAENIRELTADFADYLYGEKTHDAYKQAMMGSLPTLTHEDFQQFIRITRGCEGFDVLNALPRIHCPVWLAGSRGDLVFGTESAEQIASALGIEAYLYGAEYGHAVYDEAPDFVQKLKFFLDSH